LALVWIISTLKVLFFFFFLWFGTWFWISSLKHLIGCQIFVFTIKALIWPIILFKVQFQFLNFNFFQLKPKLSFFFFLQSSPQQNWLSLPKFSLSSYSSKLYSFTPNKNIFTEWVFCNQDWVANFFNLVCSSPSNFSLVILVIHHQLG
jgi:hypothetical protein